MSSEFEFLENLRRTFSLGKIGDDCAVLPKDTNTDMVVTADMLVEDIDFRLEWTTPHFLGHKALAVSLSDIAAMGGSPTWAMLSIAIPSKLWNEGFLDSFYEGWHGLAREYGVELVGGDISKTEGKLVIDSIVAGDVARDKAILRSTASAGDLIFVTGPLGGAAGGLKLLENDGVRFTSELSRKWSNLLLKQLQPTPQVNIGKILQTEQFASAMIDLSDGLSSDLSHVCHASRVGARIYAEQVPVNDSLDSISNSPDDLMDIALNGGEDFELLFTSNKKNFSALEKAGFFHIGDITANSDIIELITDFKHTFLEPRGYRHF